MYWKTWKHCSCWILCHFVLFNYQSLTSCRVTFSDFWFIESWLFSNIFGAFVFGDDRAAWCALWIATFLLKPFYWLSCHCCFFSTQVKALISALEKYPGNVLTQLWILLTHLEHTVEVYIHSSWRPGKFWAFNYFFKLFFFLRKDDWSHICLIKKKNNNNLMHIVIYLGFSEIKTIHTGSKLYIWGPKCYPLGLLIQWYWKSQNNYGHAKVEAS